MNGFLPVDITVNKKTKEIAVIWSDRHTSVYPFSLLRSACPCEQCRGGQVQLGNEPPPEIFYMTVEDSLANRLVSIERVGTYGISIQWEDGHSYGIYNWHYLRACCPCPICQEMRIYGQ